MSDIYDATNQVAENNAHRDKARREREDAETMRRLLSRATGRAFFHRLLENCHIYTTAFRPDPHETFFRMGEEFVGKQLQSLAINVAPDLYMQMLAEAKKEEDRLAAQHLDEKKREAAEDDNVVAFQNLDLPAPKDHPDHKGLTDG
jgi:hypothetical protein